jgi:hypothetical protein
MISCPIWGTPAGEYETPRGDYKCIDSPRCAGKFQITGTAQAMAGNLSDGEKARLTTWLIDNRQLGDLAPSITLREIEAVKTWRNLSVSERRNRLLIAASHEISAIGEKFVFATQRLGYIVGEPAPADDKIEKKYFLLAWTESIAFNEVQYLAKFAMAQGLIENDLNSVVLTFEGHALMESLKGAKLAGDQAFVAMWFSQETDFAFSEGIVPGITDCGYRPLRIDAKEHNNKIDEEIVAEIKRSKFVVADFTSGSVTAADGSSHLVSRGGVYYEAGFAQGLGIPVIWTCRKDQILDIHFDTRQYNHIIWESPNELREKLRVRIGAVIGDGPNKPA